jgi:hypothetical protein
MVLFALKKDWTITKYLYDDNKQLRRFWTVYLRNAILDMW